MTFEDTFLASVLRMEDEIREYQAQRKKLESRRCACGVHIYLNLYTDGRCFLRLSYDAAISKFDRVKHGKKEKEKERKEAEEELESAKSR